MISRKALTAAVVGLLFIAGGTATVLQSFGAVSGTATVVPPLQISEINADAVDDGGDEYVEVYNAASEPINVSKWEVNVSGSINQVEPVSNEGVLNPGEYAVIVENQSFSSQEFTVLRVSGFQLANGGDKVSLVHPDGLIIDSYNYSLDCSDSQSMQSTGPYLQRNWECRSQTLGGANS